MDVVAAFNGRSDYKEAPELGGNHSICLTYEFDALPDAESAADQLRALGEHVEGPGRCSLKARQTADDLLWSLC